MDDRLLGAASEMLHTRARPSGRQAKKRPTNKTSPGDDDPGERLEAALVMRSCGLPAWLCAAVAGVSAPTLRHWQARTSNPPAPRKATPAPVPEKAARIENLVRETHGLIGADALRHSVEGVSRRQPHALGASQRPSARRDQRAAGRQHAQELVGVLRRRGAADHPRRVRTPAHPRVPWPLATSTPPVSRTRRWGGSWPTTSPPARACPTWGPQGPSDWVSWSARSPSSRQGATAGEGGSPQRGPENQLQAR